MTFTYTHIEQHSQRKKHEKHAIKNKCKFCIFEIEYRYCNNIVYIYIYIYANEKNKIYVL